MFFARSKTSCISSYRESSYDKVCDVLSFESALDRVLLYYFCLLNFCIQSTKMRKTNSLPVHCD
ncbi:unnamed protein product [Larinioides sclopetarius]|uniref:Uncharacterized protein n=1 Tax=Larinioides sclopetarius TaxID=280406 RepID=A0AAV2A2M7_9ARAC